MATIAGRCIGSAMLLTCMAGRALEQDRGRADGSLALVGGTIYVSPAEAPIHDGVVLIANGKIAAVGRRSTSPIPQGVQSLDCSGLTITAGFWNSHVHFFERKWADAATIPAPELARQLEEVFARYGFTSVFDLSSTWENTRRIRDRIESGEVAGPSIRSTGEGLVPPGAVPPQSVLNVMGIVPTALPEVMDAASAQVAARRLLGAGVDGIKLFMSSPRLEAMAEAAIDAATREAHRLGKPVFAHPNTSEDVLAAVRGGVDIIAHTTPRSGPWDQSLLASMNERQVALVPTLALWKQSMRHDRLSAQERLVDEAVGQLRAWIAAGGSVLFGTDLGAVDADPSEEYALMADAGMRFPDLLASLTTIPAERFGESNRLGRIATGLQADLVVLRDDPSRSIRALASIQYTLRSGKVIYRALK